MNKYVIACALTFFGVQVFANVDQNQGYQYQCYADANKNGARDSAELVINVGIPPETAEKMLPMSESARHAHLLKHFDKNQDSSLAREELQNFTVVGSDGRPRTAVKIEKVELQKAPDGKLEAYVTYKLENGKSEKALLKSVSDPVEPRSQD